ncbi:GPI mannosyltransferase 1 [Marasmius tenuissimus]|nr:GPI mannosyltransferase 1 [Marasmius tenuissimus]
MSATSSLISPWSSFRFILTLSIIIRVALIVYSEWHDARSIVKYTDVDYRVFSDAAKYILHPGPGDTNTATGPLKIEAFGDPYTRETYRYTPLLALLLTPNEWLHPSFGKYLFAACDILNGTLIYKLLVFVILPQQRQPTSKKPSSPEQTSANERQATIYSAIHLLNPMVFSISTRGSSESILSLFVLATLYAMLTRRWNVAAIALGISVHWKIYPFIYGFSCLATLREKRKKAGTKAAERDVRGVWGYLSSFLNWEIMRFGILSVATFGILTGTCYLIWGYPFLYETYLYHIHRRDHRHNFSPTFISPTLPIHPLTSFIPQMVLSVGTGFLFGENEGNLPFAWFVQTVVFVVFNKVCTSQYFLWYLLLLPLILPRLNIGRRAAGLYITVWVGVQALWLSEAYKLEFLGRNTFYGLWLRGLIYVAGNCGVLGGIMEGYKSGTSPVQKR